MCAPCEVAKTQRVRLLDVFALGPFMIWYALTAKGMPRGASFVLLVAGVATIVYNARNYLRNQGASNGRVA